MNPAQSQADAPRQFHGGTLLFALVFGLMIGTDWRSAGAAEATAKGVTGQLDEQVRSTFDQYCMKCHSGEKVKGDLHLDQLKPDFTDPTARDEWQAVLERVVADEMPPKGKPHPEATEVQSLSKWINAQMLATKGSVRPSQGRVVLRRLNRAEYQNTINDLLGVEADLKEQLPQDGSANGFDNAGTALHTSGFLMERYLDAAETALNLAIVNRTQPPPQLKKRISIKDGHPIRGTTESVFRFLDDGAVVCFSSSLWHDVSVPGIYQPDGGNYRFRICTSGFQSAGKPVTFRVTTSNTRLTGTSGLVGYFDAQPDKPTITEFVQYMEPRTTIRIIPWGLAGAQAITKVGADKWEGAGLTVQYVEVEGPLYESWPPPSHRQIFGDLPQKPAPIYNQSTRVEVTSTDPLADAAKILRRFTRRAFRRAVTDEDIAPYIAIVKARMESGNSFEQSVRAALKGALMSPEFLFLREKPGTLDDFALASRLSYFLWSTMPDEELLTLAEQKKLSDPQTLHTQVERMLAHPKAVALTTNFLGQWLSLRDIDATEPAAFMYPEYDHLLKVSMIREPELFFEEVLKNDMSLTNFISCDFSMLNGRLAKHYGISGPQGWEFHKTPLPPGCHRGGLLTMAAVMKVTANGTSTSPVIRGAWVLDRILGAPTPPPPDDVPVLDPDIRGAVTIRDQLAKHRTLAMCASCHTRIDPPGFALESFDCIGGWRDNYRTAGNGATVVIDGRRMSYHMGKKVDPSDVMPDGQKFQNIDELKVLLLKDKDQLARALTTKLLTYATGAAPRVADRPDVQAIVAGVGKKNYGLRSLIHEIVQSRMFRTK